MPVSVEPAADLSDVLPPITDPVEPAPPNAFERLVDRFTDGKLMDPRDVILTRTGAEVLAMATPFTILLYLVPTWTLAVLGPAYVAFIFVRFGPRIILGLHAVTHRPLFKKPWRAIDKVWTHVIPMFVGMTPFAYFPHHRMMHHKENCSEDDLSGTAEYQRDNLLHFVHYWLRFAILGYYHMTSWLLRRGHRDVAIRMLAFEALVFAGVGVAFYLAPIPTTFAFIIPFTMLRFFLMAGNWSEHAFVDVEDPTNSWRNSVILMNTPYNHRAYNAGYHLLHHVLPGLHWAKNPDMLHKKLPKLIEEDSIVFNGVKSNQQVWWKLMTGDYGFLADRPGRHRQPPPHPRREDCVPQVSSAAPSAAVQGLLRALRGQAGVAPISRRVCGRSLAFAYTKTPFAPRCKALGLPILTVFLHDGARHVRPRRPVLLPARPRRARPCGGGPFRAGSYRAAGPRGGNPLCHPHHASGPGGRGHPDHLGHHPTR